MGSEHWASYNLSFWGFSTGIFAHPASIFASTALWVTVASSSSNVSNKVKCVLSGVRDLQVFEELFSFACPKFLSPVVPNYDNVHPNYHKEPFQQQLKVFAEEVQQQAQLSTIRR